MVVKIKKTVELSSLDELSRILGAYDENLTYLSRELGVLAYVDGLKIRLEGEEEGVQSAEEVIRALQKSTDGERIDPVRVAYCIELAKEGRADEIASMDGGTVAITARGKQIKCKTVGQKQYVNAIKKDTIVFGVGPAGTGKTYLAVCMAVSAFKSKQVEKIILTRPAVEAGERLGFLPGDLKDKLDPYLQPLYDALGDMIPAKRLQEFMAEGTIQIAPLAYMRGRTLDRACVILDEAQNTNLGQLKMFLTRMGCDAKFIVTGDASQIDLPNKKDSGLLRGIELTKHIKGIKTITFRNEDIVRHPLVAKIVKAFDSEN